MKEILWKIELFCKFVWYEAASWILKQRLKRAWIKAATMQEELDRIKNEAKV